MMMLLFVRTIVYFTTTTRSCAPPLIQCRARFSIADTASPASRTSRCGPLSPHAIGKQLVPDASHFTSTSIQCGLLDWSAFGNALFLLVRSQSKKPIGQETTEAHINCLRLQFCLQREQTHTYII